MNRPLGFARILGTVAIALFAVALVHPDASAFNLRVPQIAFNNASLQGYLNANDGGINTLTDQLDAQVWTSSVSGNASFTLMIELAGNASQNAIGIYNTNAPPNPPLFQVFPGVASAGWHASAHFGGGNLVVTLFDNNAIIQGQTFYAGVNPNAFGFYLQGPGGTFYSQDARNPAAPPMRSPTPAPARTSATGGSASRIFRRGATTWTMMMPSCCSSRSSRPRSAAAPGVL